MDIRLISFDLDGTFLDDGKGIPPENLRALEQAAARGIWIVPATGRIVAGLPEPLRTLPFMRYYITANGSYVYDALEDRAVARAEIPLARALEFYEYADGLDALYDCLTDLRDTQLVIEDCALASGQMEKWPGFLSVFFDAAAQNPGLDIKLLPGNGDYGA